MRVPATASRSAFRAGAVALAAALAFAAAAGAHGDEGDEDGAAHAPAGRAAKKKARPGEDAAAPPAAEPPTSGRGIESAVLVAAGRASVAELGDADRSRYFGAVVDLRVAAASTTALLGPGTIAADPPAEQDGGQVGAQADSLPLAAACLPTAGVQVTMWHGPGVGLHEWNVDVGGRRWFCGGRHARQAFVPGGSGVRVTTRRDGPWSGPLLLLFDTARDDVRRIHLPGAVLEVPAAGTAGNVPAKAGAGAAGKAAGTGAPQGADAKVAREGAPRNDGAAPDGAAGE